MVLYLCQVLHLTLASFTFYRYYVTEMRNSSQGEILNLNVFFFFLSQLWQYYFFIACHFVIGYSCVLVLIVFKVLGLIPDGSNKEKVSRENQNPNYEGLINMRS